MAEQRWSDVEGGLQIGLQLPHGPQRAGTTLTAKLVFRNQASKPARIYLVREDAFRSFQSWLRILRHGDSRVVSVQPEPQPHGYVVSEADFPLVEPGASRTFEQVLDLSDPNLRAGGTFVVEWTYENEIVEWKGGAQTLDGPTKELFGGTRIPHIWTGRLTTTSELRIALP